MEHVFSLSSTSVDLLPAYVAGILPPPSVLFYSVLSYLLT